MSRAQQRNVFGSNNFAVMLTPLINLKTNFGQFGAELHNYSIFSLVPLLPNLTLKLAEAEPRQIFKLTLSPSITDLQAKKLDSQASKESFS